MLCCCSLADSQLRHDIDVICRRSRGHVLFIYFRGKWRRHGPAHALIIVY